MCLLLLTDKKKKHKNKIKTLQEYLLNLMNGSSTLLWENSVTFNGVNIKYKRLQTD